MLAVLSNEPWEVYHVTLSSRQQQKDAHDPRPCGSMSLGLGKTKKACDVIL